MLSCMVENGNSKILAIVVTYNAMHWIEKCLKSLISSVIAVDILIVDNNSADGTIEYIKKQFPKIRLFENNINLGFGKANNIGFKYAIEQNIDYVFLLNQDACIENNTIEKLVSFYRKNSQFGILSPVQLNGKGTELDENFSNYISIKKLENIKKAISSNILKIETNFVNAASWMISKECLIKVGGFDPMFCHYGEDRDYCYRVSYHDFKIGVLLSSTISHDRIYSKKSKYRKIKNLIFTVGLAHVKNVNNSLLKNYITWFILRMRNILKSLLKFKFSLTWLEFVMILKIVFMISQIIESRKNSKTIEKVFLS